jgi:hypothetical protein
MDHFSVRDHRNYAWRCQHGVVQQSDSIQFFVQDRTTIKTHVVRSLPVVLAEWTLKAANQTFSSRGCGFESHERFLVSADTIPLQPICYRPETSTVGY